MSNDLDQCLECLTVKTHLVVQSELLIVLIYFSLQNMQ